MSETLTTEELAERLRFIATVKADGNARAGRKGPAWAKEAEIEWQAAAALAVVTAERDALRRANDAYVYLGADGKATTGRALEDRALAAESEWSSWQRLAEIENKRANAAEAERDALRKALEPFDDVFGEDEDYLPDDTKVTLSFGPCTAYGLMIGDLRRARALLTKEKINE